MKLLSWLLTASATKYSKCLSDVQRSKDGLSLHPWACTKSFGFKTIYCRDGRSHPLKVALRSSVHDLRRTSVSDILMSFSLAFLIVTCFIKNNSRTRVNLSNFLKPPPHTTHHSLKIDPIYLFLIQKQNNI